MSWNVDLFSPYLSATATRITLIESFSGNQVRLDGIDFTYDAGGRLSGGRVTALALYDASGTNQIQSITLPSAVQATSFLARMTTALQLHSQMASWSFEGSDGNDTVSAAGVSMRGQDGTWLVIDISDFNQAANTGTVTAITHYAADGTTVLHQATGLPLDVPTVEMAFGSSRPVYAALTAGDNVVTGSGTMIQLDGGAGNDTIAGAASSTSFDGNWVTYENAAAGVTVNLEATTAYGTATGGGGNDRLINIQSVSGSTFGDNLAGSAAANSLRGDDGNDTLSGRGGNDRLDASNGNDNLDGGAGDDDLRGGAGDDSLAGGTGIDTANYRDYGDISATSGVTVDLRLTGDQTVGGGHGVDRLIGIENIDGTGFGDKLIGNTGGNLLRGNGGNDTLNGGAGADTLQGGAGDDVYVVDGTDQIWESALGGTDTMLVSAPGVISMQQDIENLTYTGTGAISVYGNGLANSVTGRAGADALQGSAGSDTINGGAGNDLISGDTFGVADAPAGRPGISMGSGRVVKSAALDNSSMANAVDVSKQFSLAANPDIAGATTTPHVTVSATGGGHVAYYKLTINYAGASIAADIDHGFGQSGPDQTMVRRHLRRQR